MSEKRDSMQNRADEEYGNQKGRMFAEQTGSKSLEIEEDNDLMDQRNARYESLKNPTSRGRDDMKE